MTFHNQKQRQAICSACGHDLIVKRTPNKEQVGRVFCSSRRCEFHKAAHPTGPELNAGKQAA